MGKKSYAVEEFLERPKKLEEEIQRDIDHIASLRSIVERKTTRLSFTAGTNPSKDDKAFEKVMIQIADEEEKLAKKRSRLVEERIEVENFISEIPDKDQQKVLRYKFIRGYPMKEIQTLMMLSRPGVYRLFDRAISFAESIYKKRQFETV